ncbi:CBS domain-containing protein [Sediminibacillus massiliensis]|uniref:CBS domain-containing protein n=1 Tax=Sediminibacillus massiliensis TaxID=1926277 RepID=UPI00098879D0|nr:CBS domain-containing protein [Sediminibacillus massiliensis]
MQAHQIMKSDVIKVKETENVRSVIEKFIEHGISGLPIVNDRNEIKAYISDGDVMRFIGKQKDYVVDMFSFVNVIEGNDVPFEERAKNILEMNVLKIAKRRFIKVFWNDSIENVAAILGEKQIKKLPVERDGVLVGIISRGDVIRHSFKTLL